MCGIFLIYKKSGFLKKDINIYIENAKLLKHRGNKDSYRIINNKYGSLLLYHNKLDIDSNNNIDQPIIKNNIITMIDGKIYNYTELYNEIKKDLPSYNFKSNSNAEILIPLYLLHGSGFISKLRGMFSFVLYDATKNILIIARDHLGITSLYYSVNKDILMVSSEMKALTNLSKNINLFESGKVYINNNFFTHYNSQSITYPNLSYDIIKINLINTIKKHILSDQPIGVILNSDVYSTILISLLIDLKKNKSINNIIKTYSIGIDSSPDLIISEKISELLDTDHTVYNFTKEDFIDILEDILENVIYYTESYNVDVIHESIILYLLSMQIKEDSNIKVLISGRVFYKDITKVNILHKIVMANTLELRMPFLDRDFIINTYNNDIAPNKILSDQILMLIKDNKSNNILDLLLPILKNYVEKKVSDEEIHNLSLSKEEYLYKTIYLKFYSC